MAMYFKIQLINDTEGLILEHTLPVEPDCKIRWEATPGNFIIDADAGFIMSGYTLGATVGRFDKD